MINSAKKPKATVTSTGTPLSNVPSSPGASSGAGNLAGASIASGKVQETHGGGEALALHLLTVKSPAAHVVL